MGFIVQEQRPVEVRVFGVASGQNVVTVFHCAVIDGDVGVASPYEALNILLAVQTDWRASMLPVYGQSYRVDRYEIAQVLGAQLITPPEPYKRPYVKLIFGASENFQGGAGDAGLVAGPYLPSMAAITVRKRGANRDKTYRGSFRIGAQPITILEGGGAQFPNQITAGARLAALNAFLQFRLLQAVVQQPGKRFRYVILSRKRFLEHTLEKWDFWSAESTSAYVNPYLGGQSTRKEKAVAH